MRSAGRFILLTFGTLTLLSACAFSECNRAKQQSAMAALQLHAQVTLDRNEVPSWILGPRGISPIMPRSSDDPVASAITTLNQIREVFCATENDGFASTGRTEHDKRLDRSVVRIKQTYRGMDVVGTGLNVNMTADDVITINGSFRPDIDLPMEPAIDSQKAATIARAHVAGRGATEIHEEGVGDLTVFVDQSNRAYLTYPVTISYWIAHGSGYAAGVHRDTFFIDAMAGAVVGTMPLIFKD